MKKKAYIILTSLCIISFLFSGCQSKKNTSQDPPESENTETAVPDEPSVNFASAYLDALYKKDFTNYAQLSGQSEENLNLLYENHLETFFALDDIDFAQTGPGVEEYSTEFVTEYTASWENILAHAQYTVTDFSCNDESCTFTLETQKLNLYSNITDIYKAKLEEVSDDANAMADWSNTYHALLVDTYSEALALQDYEETVSTTFTMGKGSDNAWILSQEDMEKIDALLFDLELADSAFNIEEDDSASYSEGMPNMEYPDDVDDTPSYKTGETHIFKDGTKELATFTIDKVELSNERNDYNGYNPDKILLITYTYENLAYDTPLLIDRMSFRVLDGDTVCSPYYISNSISPNLAIIGEGPVTASFAYGISNSCKEVIIYIENQELSDPFCFISTIE